MVDSDNFRTGPIGSWLLVVLSLEDSEAGKCEEGGGVRRRALSRGATRWRPKPSTGRLSDQSGRFPSRLLPRK